MSIQSTINIHSSDEDWITFSAPYYAKKWLSDSICRTEKGWKALKTGALIEGSLNIIAARVQSIGSFLLAGTSGSLEETGALVMLLFTIPATLANLGSRLPLISRFQVVQEFTHDSSDFILRTLRINWIAPRVILLFLSATAINIFLPLKTENIFHQWIHQSVESYGKLKTITATLEDESKSHTGTTEAISILGRLEEYLRALSYKNDLKEVRVYEINHTYRYHR